LAWTRTSLRPAVVAVEWAERLPRALPGARAVRLQDAGGDSRTIEIA